MAVRNAVLPERYSDAQPIGRGGMGEIYLATDAALDRAVAVKVLGRQYAQDASVRRRFMNEALAVARLSGNPSIVTIYDVGEWRGRPYIVMEYLGGGSLEDRLREGMPPPAQALEWLEQAASALDIAHREGIVHRDVKPANLLLDRHGRVHVADFGIARAVGLDSLTQTGTVLGTAAYLSPEQAAGQRATPASDQYALAVVAFELLTGKRPFAADSVAAEAAAHVSAEVPAASGLNRQIPREVDRAFVKALAKDPAERFGGCVEFVAALRDALERAAGPTAVLVPPTPVPPPARRRRSLVLPLVGLLLFAAAGGAVAGALLAGGTGRTALPPQRASVSVKTVTEQGTTVQQTVTAPPPATTTSSGPASPSGSSDPHALNDRAWALMNQGRYEEALPLLLRAVQQLQGRTDDAYDAYANFNLGVTLINLGRCSAAVPYLEVAKGIEPSRHEVHDALKTAQHCGG